MSGPPVSGGAELRLLGVPDFTLSIALPVMGAVAGSVVTVSASGPLRLMYQITADGRMHLDRCSVGDAARLALWASATASGLPDRGASSLEPRQTWGPWVMVMVDGVRRWGALDEGGSWGGWGVVGDVERLIGEEVWERISARRIAAGLNAPRRRRGRRS
ncbi:hypothetical protein [Actinocorallia herbida]|uniref:hypothetical protein n=1 Tax=Actinocorallia herbida TaxID=58109 RepID=UPI0011CE0A39|nr:hypothetical protein [Actinocorallia herbida]